MSVSSWPIRCTFFTSSAFSPDVSVLPLVLTISSIFFAVDGVEGSLERARAGKESRSGAGVEVGLFHRLFGSSSRSRLLAISLSSMCAISVVNRLYRSIVSSSDLFETKSLMFPDSRALSRRLYCSSSDCAMRSCSQREKFGHWRNSR